jgi:DDE superfamily endonuclease
LQIHRWLPGRRIVLVGDTAFAAIGFLAAVRSYVSVVTRLRLDAGLYAPAPPKRPGRGRPPVNGKRLPTLSQVLHDAQYHLAAPHRPSLVRPHQSSCRDRHRHRGLVP